MARSRSPNSGAGHFHCERIGEELRKLGCVLRGCYRRKRPEIDLLFDIKSPLWNSLHPGVDSHQALSFFLKQAFRNPSKNVIKVFVTWLGAGNFSLNTEWGDINPGRKAENWAVRRETRLSFSKEKKKGPRSACQEKEPQLDTGKLICRFTNEITWTPTDLGSSILQSEIEVHVQKHHPDDRNINVVSHLDSPLWIHSRSEGLHYTLHLFNISLVLLILRLAKLDGSHTSIYNLIGFFGMDAYWLTTSARPRKRKRSEIQIDVEDRGSHFI